MPWKAKDATRHNKGATTPKSKRAFAHASNDALKRGLSEGAAVRIGNAAANKSVAKSRRRSK